MADSDEPLPPSLPWRIGSVMVMGGIGTLVRTFMNIPNTQRAHGLDKFLDLVDDREDVGRRKRGLITGRLLPSPLPARNPVGDALLGLTTQSTSLEPYMRVRTYHVLP